MLMSGPRARSPLRSAGPPWRLIALLFLILTQTAVAQQPANTIATFGPVRAVSASYNGDDGYYVVLVGNADGKLEEIFYKAPSNQVPTQVGRSVLATFEDIVSVAGFYAADDHNRIAIVATRNGDIHEVFYHPARGRGQSVIGHFDGIVGIAAFYNEDDKFRVVLVATQDGNIQEIFYHPGRGRGEGVLATYPGVIAISGHFDVLNQHRTVLVATNDGTLHSLQYRPGKPRIARETSYITGRTTTRVVSLASNTWATMVVTSDQTLRRCANNLSAPKFAVSCSADNNIDGLRLVSLSPKRDDPNLVYTTASAGQRGDRLAGGIGFVPARHELHRFIFAEPPPPAPTPRIATFKADPSDYFNAGGSTTLRWQIDTCQPTCEVTLTARHGFNYADIAFQKAGLGTTGSLPVTPVQQHTQYTLSAKSAAGSDQKNVDVALYYPSPPCAQCGVHFFRMTRTSGVTPCFTLAIYGPDPVAAKALAEAQNGGYAAEAITEQEYYDGCN